MGTRQEAEAARLLAQAEFERRASQSQRNRLGQFATPPMLAVSMVGLARQLFPNVTPIRFLDPGLGTGVFYSALLETYGAEAIAWAVGVESDPGLAAIAERLWKSLGLKVLSEDFTRIPAPNDGAKKPNLIVCNPPYVRHHHLSGELKAHLRSRTASLGFAVNGLTGLYAYFLLLAHEWLAADGGAVWIIPAEFLDVNYGAVLKHYLREEVRTLRIHRFEPSDVQFDDALVTSVVVAFRKRPPEQGAEILLTGGSDLLRPTTTRQVRGSDLDPRAKWAPYFVGAPIAAQPGPRHKLGDLFAIKRGLATGDNKFFVLDAGEAKDLGLPSKFLRPILPGVRHMSVDVIESDADGFPRNVRPLVLLDCPLPRTVVKQDHPELDRYLAAGERRGVPELYLPKSRRPWYRQERRAPAPILCTYMGRKKRDGRTFRFIRNHSKATAHNVYLLLYPKDHLAAALRADPTILDRVFQYLRSVPDVERVGRVYGGGLSKLEPSELANLAIPAKLLDDIRELAALPTQLEMPLSVRAGGSGPAAEAV